MVSCVVFLHGEMIDYVKFIDYMCCVCLRPPRCFSTGPVMVCIAEMAIERERERAGLH